jgi:levanase/fructan beta-fructosidase
MNLRSIIVSLAFCPCIRAHAQNTEQYRPTYHFTPAKNWTNDPNGVIYLNGVYHLYNQQNPFENKWGHMSWGHAISKDLVHWQHLPIAIPEKIDKDTTWIFSGCAVWDRDNTSGFCKGGGCIVAVYTADQPNLHKESQYIAYSNDGGMSFTNYANNPVIDLSRRDFRDPNVRWNDQLHQWLMVVAMPRDEKVRFYVSGDLKKWNLLSEFGPAGFTGGIWECPSFFPVRAEGGDTTERWILMTSCGGGRHPQMQYFVGHFDGNQFINDNPPDTRLLVDQGDVFYAAIPWNHTPPGQDILIGWLVPGQRPTSPWRGQMSIPRDMHIYQGSSGWRLREQPTAVIRSQLSGYQKKTVHDLSLPAALPGGEAANSYWADFDLDAAPGTVAEINLGVGKTGAPAARIVFEPDSATLKLIVDPSAASGPEPDRTFHRIPLEKPGGHLQLTVLMDKSSLELFVNNGEAVLSTYLFPLEGATGLSADTKKGSAKINSMTIYDLSNVRQP